MYKTKPERRLDASPTILAWREPFWDGVRFGLARGYLSTDGARLWQHNSVEVDGDEVEDAMKAARSFGRLLARVPDDLQRARILGVEFE